MTESDQKTAFFNGMMAGYMDRPRFDDYREYNMIMPVVELIESEGHPVYISSNNCTIYEKPGRDHGWMIDKHGTTKLEAIFEAVGTYILKRRELNNADNK